MHLGIKFWKDFDRFWEGKWKKIEPRQGKTGEDKGREGKGRGRGRERQGLEGKKVAEVFLRARGRGSPDL